MSFLALITARGGSKGLPRKNVLPLMGKPLISWTIEAALESKYVDDAYVSTEDEEIAEISRSYGAKVLKRPLRLALDDTSSEPVIEHFLTSPLISKLDCKDIILLQPTSPLRNQHHIDEAYKSYIDLKSKCVISVFEPKHTPAKAYQLLDNGEITGLFNSSAPYCRRQDLPLTFQPNGAIYIFSAVEFLKNCQIPRDKVFPYIMSEELSLDVDTDYDLNLCEQFLRVKK